MSGLHINKHILSRKDNGFTTSVALCTYNGEKYILEQLTSIVHQTVLPNEIVICDDNSSDSTVRLIDSFIQTHKTVGLILNYSERI